MESNYLKQQNTQGDVINVWVGLPNRRTHPFAALTQQKFGRNQQKPHHTPVKVEKGFPSLREIGNKMTQNRNFKSTNKCKFSTHFLFFQDLFLHLPPAPPFLTLFAGRYTDNSELSVRIEQLQIDTARWCYRVQRESCPSKTTSGRYPFLVITLCIYNFQLRVNYTAHS